MSRRKRKYPIEPGLAFKLLGTLMCLWLAIKLLQSPLVLLIVAAIVIAIVVVPRHLRQERLKSLYGKVNEKIEQHLDQLARKRTQLVRYDSYGKLRLKDWIKETEYFITHHVSPSLTGGERFLLESERAAIVAMIAERVAAATKDQPVYKSFADNMTPSEFELFCAEQLRQSGWDARVTQQSRDQGIDVIAEKRGVRVVLQCKLYSGPVGNNAVQQIAAGKAHEQAHHGVVVTNSRYTASAEQLASTNRVLLLHYGDLTDLETLLR